MIGKVIDNYTIIEELGRGGMGVVYKAKEDNIRFVALKLITSDRSNDLDFLGLFEREAKSMATLEHPNIVKLLRYKSGHFLVMDYIRGKTLQDVLDGKSLDVERVTRIFTVLLDALEYAHRIGVVHRDLKPTNIMIREDGVVKVMDFGIAKLREYSTSPTVTIASGGKQAPQATTLRAFSPGYSAPEQELGTLGDVDARGDIFSLGVILYECLTGKSSPTKERKRITLEDFDDRVPRPLAKVVIKATEEDKTKRFQSATEMLEALRKCEKGGDAPGPRWTKPVVAGFLVVLALAVGILMIQNQPSSQGNPVISVNSEPQAANIFLDNRVVGQTPLDSLVIDPGEHTIGLVKEGFERKDTGFVLGQDATADIFLKLQKTVSGTTLTVLSSPTGAKAYLDDAFIGITPVSSYPATPGVRRLRVEKDGFPSMDSTVNIMENQNISASLKLQRAVSKATLILGTVPNGTVSVNGETRMVAGTSTFQLNPGIQSILFRHPEYGTKTTSLRLESAQSQTLICHFETRVSIVSNSDAGNPIPSLILVNGKTMGEEAPGVIKLGPGTYRIGVTKAGYTVKEPEREITLVPSLEGQKEIELVFTLKKL